MNKTEQDLVNHAKSIEKELNEKALVPGNNSRYVSVALIHEKVEHQIIYDRQLAKFVKIVYLMRIKGINIAKEIRLFKKEDDGTITYTF